MDYERYNTFSISNRLIVNNIIILDICSVTYTVMRSFIRDIFLNVISYTLADTNVV